ncbi:MAG: L-aspartate oxidase [Proteobacteria bacterium]|jgi:L-aspartate oxidase|nr:L-aspartate oxidase [Pseudomonadota bacterium]
MSLIERHDYLVIGSGLAGLAFALKVMEQDESNSLSVAVVTKDKAPSANTSWAQGGIAAVMSDEDSFEDHIHDTLHAGAGLCDASVVRNYIEQAPERILDLQRWGVHFDLKENSKVIDLTREGGHSHRRILHFEDHTGSEIHRALLEQCRKHPRIHLFEDFFAIDLILNRHIDPKLVGPSRCVGAYVLNKQTSEVSIFLGRAVILSTGGAGKVYLYTSNWSGATGDGIAMAFRAGARVANLEFMQFHPTCLYHRESRNFLISEALRGEGGELINSQGVRFMKKYHPMGSLAPRDIVARSIDSEMKKSGEPCVFLDMRHLSRDKLKTRFPVIFQKCLDYGIDISTEPIPVVPAAHYLCGGVLTDPQGKTDIEALYALGETACSGLHGANRLASNSLLECLAMAHNAAQEISPKNLEFKFTEALPRPWIHPHFSDQDELSVINHMWDEIRRLMWNYVGIVRSNKRLERASHRLENILSEVKDYYSNFKIHPDIIELRNIAIVADLTVKCALKRKESRGIHYNLDYPWTEWTEKDRSEGRASDSILFRGSSKY